MPSINVGIDLGSTYTTVSVYDEDMKYVKAISLESDNPYVPSVVSREGKKFNFGRTAKVKTARSNVKVFKAFKMLLNETSPDKLRQRDYDAIDNTLSQEEQLNLNTPEQITKRFLEYLLKKTMDYMNADSIDKLVIGVPEIWNEVSTYGGRKVLRDICCGFPFVAYKDKRNRTKNVEVISEPSCASAFIAHKYFGEYNGDLLLIDYGGGTLDITLSSIITDERGQMEILVLDKKGAGENVQKKVGQAGIIYMETIVERAILEAFREAGIDRPVEYDSKFYAAVNELEMEIVGDGKERIEDYFEQYNMNLKKMKRAIVEAREDEEDEEDWKFTTLEYHGEDVVVSYALLLESYQEVIAPTLDEQLDLINAYMDNHKITYNDSTKDNFKVAIVGGFGKYYPVIKQVEKKYCFSANDKRRVELPENHAEQAISLGAALLAEKHVKLHKTARFSLGMLSMNQGQADIAYAITFKQDIEPGRIYYAKDSDGENYVFGLYGDINQFVLNFGEDNSTATLASIKDSVKEKLKTIRTNQYKTATIGFSFDESEVITMHIIPWDPLKGLLDESIEDTQYVLSRFDEMFSITKYKPIN